MPSTIPHVGTMQQRRVNDLTPHGACITVRKTEKTQDLHKLNKWYVSGKPKRKVRLESK